MIYSQWRPSDGKYDYFETSEKIGLGDDMPTPPVPMTSSPIGVASVAVGRKPTGSVRKVGEGEVPLGSIMPTTTMDLGILADREAVYLGLALLSGVVIGYLMKGDRRANR